MKILMAAALMVSVFLVGCSKEKPESANQASQEKAAVAPAPAQKVLLPTFASAGHCLSTCISTWWSSAPGTAQELVSKFEPTMPLSFAELLSVPEEHARFVQLVEKFPPHLHPIGKLQPKDEEKLVDNGAFGSYKKELPKMFGWLGNAINVNDRIVYVYSSVHYFRLADRISGSLHVAIDPATHEYAGVIRAGADLDEYYVAGADSLRSTLLAFTVASDLETAEMLAHYANKNQGRYETRPVMLPLNKSLDEALARVVLLNDRLGQVGQATGVPAPGFLQQAMAAQAKNTWYGVSQGRDRCIESPMSPAQRIDLIKEAGVTPRVRDTTSNGTLTAVEISAAEGGNETTWRFFKSKDDCDRTVASSTPTSDKYR